MSCNNEAYHGALDSSHVRNVMATLGVGRSAGVRQIHRLGKPMSPSSGQLVIPGHGYGIGCWFQSTAGELDGLAMLILVDTVHRCHSELLLVALNIKVKPLQNRIITEPCCPCLQASHRMDALLQRRVGATLYYSIAAPCTGCDIFLWKRFVPLINCLRASPRQPADLA